MDGKKLVATKLVENPGDKETTRSRTRVIFPLASPSAVQNSGKSDFQIIIFPPNFYFSPFFFLS